MATVILVALRRGCRGRGCSMKNRGLSDVQDLDGANLDTLPAFPLKRVPLHATGALPYAFGFLAWVAMVVMVELISLSLLLEHRSWRSE